MNELVANLVGLGAGALVLLLLLFVGHAVDRTRNRQSDVSSIEGRMSMPAVLQAISWTSAAFGSGFLAFCFVNGADIYEKLWGSTWTAGSLWMIHWSALVVKFDECRLATCGFWRRPHIINWSDVCSVKWNEGMSRAEFRSESDVVRVYGFMTNRQTFSRVCSAKVLSESARTALKKGGLLVG
ncbi:MAG: hypothetical protein IPM29_17245 [Planctomycetes bacterium]|nr:hypothetical protein [Planctomycetota bacterium]